MVASLLKIVSTGMQDERLQPPKDQPDMGAFFTVIVKAGRYATAWARIDFDTKPDFGKSSVIRIPTQGELVGRVMLVTQMPDIKTIQDIAYKARKPLKLFSNNYTNVDMVKKFQYVKNYSRNVANTNLTGIQLNNLYIGGTYSLTFTVPSNTENILSLYLTEVGLDQNAFNDLNSGTFTIPNLHIDSLPDINSKPAGYIATWSSDPIYKTGINYHLFLYNTPGTIINMPTYSFKASQTTHWLTFGVFNPMIPVTMNLQMVSPTNPPVVSDLVGPHFGWTNSLGHALINNVSLRIGGSLVDTIPGQLMEVIDEFQTPLERVNETSSLLCRDMSGFNQSRFGTQTTGQIVTTPLPFWFSRGDPGCFLPIDALNNDEVRITVQFNPITRLYYTDSRIISSSGEIMETDIPGGGLWPLAKSQFYYEDPNGEVILGLEPYRTTGKKFTAFSDINMPAIFTIPESYLMVEYIYLDKPEANRFRIADLQVPVVQHYAFDPVDNQNNQNVRIPLIIPNPTRDIFFYCNRYEAQGYNAPFLGTRDLSSNLVPQAPWWPDSSGLDDHYYSDIKAGFSSRNSEPIRWLALDYAETLNRYSTENVALFRSVLPSIEQRKAPFVNRYYYNFPLGIQNGFTPFSMPIGEANLDKVLRLNLTLGFHGKTGRIDDVYVDRYITYVYAETYNIFRVYGGRGALMFAY